MSATPAAPQPLSGDEEAVMRALGRLILQFDSTLDTMQWVATGYTLAFALTLITGGRLGDRRCGDRRRGGRRWGWGMGTGSSPSSLNGAV